MDAGKGYKTPSWRPRTLLLMVEAAARGLHWFVLVGSQRWYSPHQVPQGGKESSWWVALWERDKWKQTCSLFGGDVTSSLKTAHGKHYSEKWPRYRAARAFHLGHIQQECVEGHGAWWIALPSTEIFLWQRWSLIPTYPLQPQFHSLLCIEIFPWTYFFRLFSLFCCDYLPLSLQSF